MSKISGSKILSGPDLSLTPDQQLLLRAALASNQSSTMPAVDSNSLAHDLSTMKSGGMQSTTNPEQKPQTIDLGRSNSDAQIPPFQAPSEFANLGDGGLLGDFLLDLQFEPGNSGWANNSQQTFETLPENLNHDGEAELHDKRKNPESVEDEEGDSKRRESEDKTVKKPGRKPLTEEPTTVSSPGINMSSVLI